MTLLDIYEMPDTKLEKAARAVDNTTTYMKLIGFGQNVAQGTVVGGANALAKAVGQSIRNLDLKPILDLSPDLRSQDRRTYMELEREGFVPKAAEYLGNDLSDAGRVAIEIGTAQPIENFFRSRAAISLMRNELGRNGVNTKGLTKDNDVITAWNTFTKSGDPARVQVARTNILSDLDSLGDSSNQGRYDAPYFGRVSKKFKSYFATTVGRAVADAKNLVDAVVNLPADGIQDITKDSAIRLTQLSATVAAAYAAAKSFYMDQGADEEMAEAQATEFLKWSWGGMMTYFTDPVGNALSVPAFSVPLGFITDLKKAADTKNPEQQAINVANAFRKNIG